MSIILITLKLMHDLANNVHGQNELLEQTTVQVKKIEVQNGELVSLISKSIE